MPAHTHFALSQIMFSIFPAYINICDDTTYAWCAKSHKTRAVAAIIPAITTAGIYPGVNNGAVIFIILM